MLSMEYPKMLNSLCLVKKLSLDSKVCCMCFPNDSHYRYLILHFHLNTANLERWEFPMKVMCMFMLLMIEFVIL